MLTLDVPDTLSLEDRIRERDRRIDASVRRSARLTKKPAKTLSDDPIADAINARIVARPKVWTRPSVDVALGVPAIHSAVVLISGTVGMFSVQGYRNGALMPDPPRLIVRPDPDLTPYAFYSTAAANMAKYGEIVWWIANTDGDGLASALINVPLRELQVDENAADRRYPKYRWGNRTGTRYSPANPTGRFVHIFYPIGEPYALRGQGPLQICGAANSVSVESQEWAANFYGRGGWPRDIVKYAGDLDGTPKDSMGLFDPNGLSEADQFKIQYASRDNNTPIVIDQAVESITHSQPDVGGAQMLDARQFNNGDAARQFRIPGPLIEYQQSGSSLTYQNRADLKGALLETCLMPLYLEPMEQSLSDLLSRTTVARFSVKGFLRADIKTRFEVYDLGVKNGIYSVELAQREEGIIPGDVEFAPVPAAQPASVPGPITRLSDVRCPKCNKFVAKALGAGSEIECSRCKTPVRGPETVAPAVERDPVEVHIHMPEGMVRVDSPVTVHQPDIHVDAPQITVPSPAMAISMPETDSRVEELDLTIRTLTAGFDGLRERQAERDREVAANLAQVMDANRELAEQVAESQKPRRLDIIRDPMTDKIIGATSNAA